MITEETKKLIKKELPKLIREDVKFQEYLRDILSRSFADKRETESRFDKVLDELKKDREENFKKWEEQNKKWNEQNKILVDQNKKWDDQSKILADQNKKWEDQNKKWEEQNKKWNEQNKILADQNKKWDDQSKILADQNKKWEDQNKKWDDQNEKWEEQNKKWYENQKAINRTLDNIERLSKKHDQTIGALGARWGLHSESAFRNGLRGILEDMFKVEVRNYSEFDGKGEVFGWPEEVELDIIIKNGLLIICEIKSSISKAEMYIFYKKALFYEKTHDRKASKIMVISPMVEKGALKVAKDLGIIIYSYADEVDKELLGE